MKEILAVAVVFFIAQALGKVVAKLKLPAILGWLIAGMILGPYALNILSNDILHNPIYEVMTHIFECALGLLIGTELVWKKIKAAGSQIIVTTLTQSLGTFLFVSLCFSIVFLFTGTPLYVAFVFGGIALATAPAPALSIVREFKTKGPLTSTLIPMAALDDMVGVIVFFSVMSVVSGMVSDGGISPLLSIVIIILPLIIGTIVGLFGGYLMKKYQEQRQTVFILLTSILIAAAIGIWVNEALFGKSVLNFMLIGMAFAATFSNIISEVQLHKLMNHVNPILAISLIFAILNLGAPLDYHLIFSAGIFTAVYIIARGIGKYGGAWIGGTIMKSPIQVRKYLGLTLLPHSGVSLVFTGIAVSVLTAHDPASAQLIQGTIAAAAVLNEIIAVIFAKKGFEWANEMPK